MKKAIIMINALGPDAGPDETDVLTQAESIEHALPELGYATERLFLDLDLKHAALKLQEASPDFVFNLVESLDGSGNLIHLGPSLLEHLKIPFTGCGSEAMYITSNKILAKTLMQHKGVPTPPLVRRS